MRMAECHPDRKHYGKGMCKTCYWAHPEVVARRLAGRRTPEWRSHKRGYDKLRHILIQGVTMEDYTRLVARGCEICGAADWRGQGPHIDHDHSCCLKALGCEKCFRGLLCHHCNTMLGLAKDNVDTLKAAIKYLKRKRKPK